MDGKEKAQKSNYACLPAAELHAQQENSKKTRACLL
jgi:hypothetical protein